MAFHSFSGHGDDSITNRLVGIVKELDGRVEYRCRVAVLVNHAANQERSLGGKYSFVVMAWQY